MQPKNDSHIKGIDVSMHQGNIDWHEVKADGYEFAFIKATEGIGWIDPYLTRNVEQARLAGLKVGVYHFAHPDNNVDEDVKFFLSVVGNLTLDLPYVLDLEQTKGLNREQISTFADQWLSKVKERTGKKVMLYTYTNFARNNLTPILSKWPLWIAHYGVNQPIDNGIWNEWSVFQYASDGKVNGIRGNVDMNVAERSLLGLEEKPQIEQKQMIDKPGEIWYGNGFAGLGWYFRHSDGWRLFQADLGGK